MFVSLSFFITGSVGGVEGVLFRRGERRGGGGEGGGGEEVGSGGEGGGGEEVGSGDEGGGDKGVLRSRGEQQIWATGNIFRGVC